MHFVFKFKSVLLLHISNSTIRRLSKMEALYKMKKSGLGDRATRAKAKEISSKSKRADLLASKRRIPLSTLEVDNEKVQQKSAKVPQTTQQKSTDRLEKLKEWKKAKEEARAKKERENKQPAPFRCGKPFQKQGESSSKPKPKAAHFTVGAGPPILKPAQRNTTSKTAASTSISQPNKAKPPARPQVALGSSKTTHNTTVVTRTSSRPVAHGSSKTTHNTTVVTRTSSRLAAKQKKECISKSTTSKKPQTRSVTRSAKSVKEEKKSPVQRKTKPKQTSTKKTKSTENSKKKPNLVQEEIVPKRIKPVTPVKSHVPVSPSPLLKCQRSKAPFVNHPAWIPNTVLSPKMNSEPNFDNAFKTVFSPFQFTAGTENDDNKNKFAFTFKKDIPVHDVSTIHHDSLDEDSSVNVSATEDEGQCVTPNPKQKWKSLRKSHSSKKGKRQITKCEDDSAVQVLNLEEEDSSVKTNLKMAPVDEPDKEQVDIEYFRRLHSDVVDKLVGLCQVWEEKAAGLEQDETDGIDHSNMEEVLGQIRTTVCQAQLLMRQKLKQYIGLVNDAETQSGENKTTAEDLQGFWDMVYFQVEDVNNKFNGLVKIESNGWQHRAPTPKKRRGKKRQAATKKHVAQDASNNERLQAAREKREAERNRLREMRMAAKRAREQENSESVQHIELECVTPKKQKTSYTPGSNSASRNRRRSQRLLNKCVFSPVERSPAQHMFEVDVPTAVLLDL